MAKLKLMIQIEPEIRREIEIVAEAEGRSLSNTARRVLAEWAKNRSASNQQHAAA